MAKVTAAHAATTYTLELTEAEAQYVRAALFHVRPRDDQFGEGGADPVWDALGEALMNEGVNASAIFATPI